MNIRTQAYFEKIKKIGIFLLMIFLGVSLIRNIIVVATADRRIREAEEKLAEIERKNRQLRDQVIKIGTEDYLEQQARDKLGLAREGESIVVLPDEETLRKMAPQFTLEEESLPDPIWKKWLKLFL